MPYFLIPQQEPALSDHDESKFPLDIMVAMAQNLTSPGNGDTEFVCLDEHRQVKVLYALSPIVTARSDYFAKSLSPNPVKLINMQCLLLMHYQILINARAVSIPQIAVHDHTIHRSLGKNLIYCTRCFIISTLATSYFAAIPKQLFPQSYQNHVQLKTFTWQLTGCCLESSKKRHWDSSNYPARQRTLVPVS